MGLLTPSEGRGVAMSLTKLRVILCAGALLLILLASPGVFADEMKEVVVEKYGYKLKVPAQFEKWGPIYEEVIKSFELISLKSE